MRIWIITVGEPLPLPGNRDRLWRTGLLAYVLASRGHEVLWWTSTVDHFRKAFFVRDEPRLTVADGLSIQFLSGRLYRRNVSLKRLLNHFDLGRRFLARTANEASPDIVLCSYPTIELSVEAVRYGQRCGVPVILDVRDLWPDIFLEVLPRPARAVGALLLRRQFRDAAWALTNSSHLFAVSDKYLEWSLSKAQRARSSNDRVFPLGYQQAEWSRSDHDALMNRLSACGADLRKPLAVFVGTFGRSYDLDTVIAAAAQLSRKGNCEVQFVLCGAGEYEQKWRKAARGNPSVAFPGWLPAGELACLLSNSYVGLAAYASGASQGIPNKVIEYVSAGLPVLCSLPGESRRLLESARCGLHYPAGDSLRLAETLQRLVDDQIEYDQMKVAARELFERCFAANKVYGDMADCLETIAAGGVEARAFTEIRPSGKKA